MERLKKLYILITLTFLFFFLELIVGYYAGSIALVADAFHMFSDVLSLVVAVYAIKVFYAFRCLNNDFSLRRKRHSSPSTHTAGSEQKF